GAALPALGRVLGHFLAAVRAHRHERLLVLPGPGRDARRDLVALELLAMELGHVARDAGEDGDDRALGELQRLVDADALDLGDELGRLLAESVRRDAREHEAAVARALGHAAAAARARDLRRGAALRLRRRLRRALGVRGRLRRLLRGRVVVRVERRLLARRHRDLVARGRLLGAREGVGRLRALRRLPLLEEREVLVGRGERHELRRVGGAAVLLPRRLARRRLAAAPAAAALAAPVVGRRED